MRIILYFLIVAITFMALPIYAKNEVSQFDRSFYEYSVSNEVIQIIRDLGIILYRKNRLEQAQQQFNVVLLVNPQDKIALKYSKLIRKRLGEKEEESAAELPLRTSGTGLSKEEFVGKQVESMMELYETPEAKKTPAKPAPKQDTPDNKPETSHDFSFPTILILDAKTKESTYTIELTQNEVIAIKGKTIRRFLVTQPNIVRVEQKTDTLYVTGNNLGRTYLHIWDKQQRWTVELLTILEKNKSAEEIEELLFASERAKNLQVRYAAFGSYNEFKNLSSESRFTHYYYMKHILETAQSAETPYGDFGFSLSLNSFPGKTELANASLRLHNGKIGSFRDLDIQAIDFIPAVSDLAFSPKGLRGVQIAAPLFENKLHYNAFWGKEVGASFGEFAPIGIINEKTDVSFSGVSVGYQKKKYENYILSAYNSWGKDKPLDQNNHAYDLKAIYEFKNLQLAPEIAFDTKAYASTLKINYNLTSLQVISEFRNISKDYQAITGRDYRAGQKGMYLDLRFPSSGKLLFSSQLDVYQDRLFPNPDFPNRWNQEVSLGSLWRANALFELQGDYSYRNALGRNFPTIVQAAGLSVRHKLPTERRIYFYTNFNYYQNRSIRTPILDYQSDKITAGCQINLLNTLNYFLEKEVNWIKSLSSAESAVPEVLQTGIEWSSQVSDSPFYQTTRLTYRDEQNALSRYSFLVGEDYLEGSGEIAYVPTPNLKFNLTGRIKAIRPEIQTANKRLEADFFLSLNTLWDTNLRWDPIGTIEGYVFKDINLDGIRQENEPPIEGAELRISRHQAQRTNEFGAYKFVNVKSKKTHVTIDNSTIPDGFILTVPGTQEAIIVHKGTTVVNFGVSSRTEIHGAVFEDTNGDNRFSPGDKGIPGVNLILQDGTNITTDSYGVFSKRLPPGEYHLKLDVTSLPEMYIPTVPVFFDFDLTEGQSINHSIPLRIM